MQCCLLLELSYYHGKSFTEALRLVFMGMKGIMEGLDLSGKETVIKVVQKKAESHGGVTLHLI